MTDIAVRDASHVDPTVRLAADGDEAAFARLVNRHYAAMSRVAYAVSGDTQIAQDAVQSAWSIAWRRLGKVRQPAEVGSWLVAVAANEARQVLRRRRRVTIIDISGVQEDEGASDPADAIGVIDLERALRHLSADDRMRLSLRFVGGLDSTEIGRHLGISASGVRSRLARLLGHLRRELDRG